MLLEDFDSVPISNNAVHFFLCDRANEWCKQAEALIWKQLIKGVSTATSGNGASKCAMIDAWKRTICLPNPDVLLKSRQKQISILSKTEL